MAEIKKVLKLNKCEYCDKNLPWGAKAISYLPELKTAIIKGCVPVLVELDTKKLPALILKKCIVIDHHNAYKNRKASILQVLHLLKLQPSREQLLIAANDSGYIPAMIKMGETMKEIEKIRRLDWLAQGITPQKTEQVLKEYAAREVRNNVIIVHQKEFCFAPATDKAFFEQNILFICEDGRTVWFNTPEKSLRCIRNLLLAVGADRPLLEMHALKYKKKWLNSSCT